jgi:hypothetical protein
MFMIVTDDTGVHDEYFAFVSLSDRIITLNRPWASLNRPSRYEALNVYWVLRAFSSPTLPVATPYGPAFPSSFRPKPMA